MSSPDPEPQQNPHVSVQEDPNVVQEEELSAEDKQAYNKMMATLSQMNSKIENVKKKMQTDPIDNKKHKTNQITDKIIQSKETSEIMTKEDLLSDITVSYEKAVIEVYSDNSRLKKKIDEMAKLIRDQNAKIYAHTKREKELLSQNEQLRSEIAKIKDQKLMLARGHVPNQANQKEGLKEDTKRKQTQPNNQNEDFDFWSMPQNQYGKKKKDFVQDSSLWVNQKDHESVFLTEEQPTASRKKK